MNSGAVPPGAGAPVWVCVSSRDQDAASAIAEAVRHCAPDLVLIFASPGAVLSQLSADLRQGLGKDCRIVGCSSAGEISPAGYGSDCVVAIAFPRTCFRCSALVLQDLSDIPVSAWMADLRKLRAEFAPDPNRALFGILLSDGLAQQEDVLVATLDSALPHVPVVGGSAADGLDFGQTFLLLDDKIMSDVAIFVMIETELVVSEIVFAHFSPGPTRAIVTSAAPQNRTILELNDEPAAEEYARLAGLKVDELTPVEFARHPLLQRMGKRHHVRAISEVTPDNGLHLMSSIDVGTVLTLGRVEDLTQGFAAALDALPRPPLLVLGFDCILRRLALERAGLSEQMNMLFARYHIAGFNTYGEQHSGMHVNQTFVGLAFIAPEPHNAA